jgi:hypothetical protein
MAVVLPGERHISIAEVKQSVVGDCHPMGVSAQVLQDLLGSTKWWLGVHHPLGVRRRSQIFFKGDAIA